MIELLSNQEILDLFNSLYYIEYSSSDLLRWKSEGGIGPSKHLTGDIVGWISRGGYRETKIKVNNRKFTLKCHRIVMAIVNNSTQFGNIVIDHIDGNKLNNHPNNLRMVSQVENARNKRSCRSDAKCQLIGISELPSGRWRTRFQGDSSAIGRHIGVFNDCRAACIAYWNAKIKVEPDMEAHWKSVMDSQLKIVNGILEGVNVY